MSKVGREREGGEETEDEKGDVEEDVVEVVEEEEAGKRGERENADPAGELCSVVRNSSAAEGTTAAADAAYERSMHSVSASSRRQSYSNTSAAGAGPAVTGSAVDAFGAARS
jgi:hypothetical protein